MVWVLEHSDARLGDRLVLLALADNANDDGGDSYPSVDTIARKARISPRQVQRCLSSLKSAGHITETGTSSYGTTVYRVRMGGDNLSGVTSTTGITPEMSPEPSFEPSVEHLPPQVPHERSLGKVDRRPVKVEHEQLAREILTEWNSQTGQALTAKGWLAKIVMRIREHPGMTLDEHAVVIARTLAHPWWKDDPSPSVLYGNDACFDKALHTGNGNGNGHGALRYGRGVTTGHLAALEAQLRSEGR